MARRPAKPKSVVILGIPFEIIYKALPQKDEKNYGECHVMDRKIVVHDKLEGEILEGTILHEVCHGILNLSGAAEFMSEEQEEAAVLALETGLIQTYTRTF